jgi:hypothetical protein
VREGEQSTDPIKKKGKKKAEHNGVGEICANTADDETL